MSGGRPPILFVDVDGVISLFGWEDDERPAGSYHLLDGLHHYISGTAGERLGRLADVFELVWATGWEHRANEHLPALLGLSGRELPTLSFEEKPLPGAHWKLDALDRFAGERPAAWIDDGLDGRCERWAEEREAPTLLVPTEPSVGITEEQVERLFLWGREVSAPRGTSSAVDDARVDEPGPAVGG